MTFIATPKADLPSTSMLPQVAGPTSTEELRQAITTFVQTYNIQWLIRRLGHRTPKEAYQDATTIAAA